MTLTIVSEADQRRFWSKTRLPDAAGCMLWTDAPSAYGYGRLRVNGKQVGAHRISLLLAEGPPPPGKPESAHACRNRLCVAPEHLRWASAQENADDRERDGTALRGERHGQAKLTAVQVAEIRRAYTAGEANQPELGRQYGVQQAAISKIVLGRKWREER